MPADLQKAREIFLHAVGKLPPEQWDDYVAQASGSDAELAQQVRHFLQVHREAGSFLESPILPPGGTIDEANAEHPGSMIGPYKLLEQIGEGGMGVVWMAQQTEPVKCLVAVKLIKAGMDSKQVIARFEAERQALALMDHPNIAKVLDGGTVGQAASLPAPGQAGSLPYVGRPYFVMDLVKGMPITRYCDEHHLTPRQRLELFIPVCQAVQHAHQKGIIHRDLKPSNVLVALYDGKPVPKVIDFGVAKATGQQLTDKTLVTGFGAIVGTLEYMSPEQAEINQLDIDTRSDIYSLGVLLYELLTGSPPFTRKDLEKVGVLEMLRVIREQEPSKPSTKLSTADGLPTLAANRGTEPAKLTRLVRGELDWIVMKALEKDRNRRYETANGFAMDVQRYLADEAVQACPPSAGYRLKKFVRRNKAALAFTGLVLLILLTLTGGIGWNVRDRAARQAAVEQEVNLTIKEAEGLQEQAKWPEALSAAKRAEGLLAVGGSDELRERVRQLRNDLEMVLRVEEIPLLKGEMKENAFDYEAVDQAYSKAFTDYGIDIAGLPADEATARIRTRANVASVLVAAIEDWADARFQHHRASGRALRAVALTAEQDPWRRQVRDAVKRKDSQALAALAASPELIRQPSTSVVVLARAMGGVDLEPAKIEMLRRAQRQYPGDFWINEDLARALVVRGAPNWDEVVSFRRAALAVRPQSAAIHSNLGNALRAVGKLEEAVAAYQKAIELDPTCAIHRYGLGKCFRGQRKLDDAVDAYRKAIELNPKYSVAYDDLGIAFFEQGKLSDAIAAYRKAIEFNPKNANAHFNLGGALRKQGKLSDAIASLRKAIEANPRYALAYHNLGLDLKKQGNIEEALANYRKAIELDPKNAKPHDSLGAILCDVKHDYEGAIAEFRTAIELDPKFASAHYNLGCALERQKKQDEALVNYRKAVELDPKSALYRKGLVKSLAATGWYLVDRSDPKLRAFALAKEALDLDPKSVGAWRYLGWIQYRTGSWKDSIESLEKSCDLEGGGDGAQWIVLALAHARLAAQEGLSEKEREHHNAEARRRYEQADKDIDKKFPVRPDFEKGQNIWDFRLEARKLMGVKEMKK